MRSLPILTLTLTALLGATAAGITQNPASQDPDGPNPSTGRPIDDVIAPLLLTVEVDARGARAVQITKKPGEEYRAPHGSETMPFGWTMRDAAGVAIAEGGFDPGLIDLDPARFGQPGVIRGDVHVPTATTTLVAVPDLDDFAQIEFFRRDGGVPRQPFGTATRSLVQTR